METTHDLLTIEYLHDHTAEVLEAVAAGTDPVRVGIGDVPEVVLLSHREFERIKAERVSLLMERLLRQRTEEALKGHTVPHEQVMAEAREIIRRAKEKQKAHGK